MYIYIYIYIYTGRLKELMKLTSIVPGRRLEAIRARYPMPPDAGGSTVEVDRPVRLEMGIYKAKIEWKKELAFIAQ